MVYILSELWYENELFGYRCYVSIGNRNVRVVDIDKDEYKEIKNTYGRLFVNTTRDGRCYKAKLKLNNKGYLETGTETAKYSNDGIEAVKEALQRELYEDLESIKEHRVICAELRRKFDYFNEKYFYNKIPKTLMIDVNSRLRSTAGRFSYWFEKPYLNKIEISTRFMSERPEEVDDTLIHEMIHAYLFELGYVDEKHGKLFKREMRRLNNLGRNVTIYVQERFTAKKYKFALQCVECGKIFKYARELKYDVCRYHCPCGGRVEISHRGHFYSAYRCNYCNEVFFEDDVNMVGQEQNCPYCSRLLEII